LFAHDEWLADASWQCNRKQPATISDALALPLLTSTTTGKSGMFCRVLPVQHGLGLGIRAFSGDNELTGRQNFSQTSTAWSSRPAGVIAQSRMIDSAPWTPAAQSVSRSPAVASPN